MGADKNYSNDFRIYDSDTAEAKSFWESSSLSTQYCISDSEQTYEVTCSVCGKRFKTSSPKQDVCYDCLSELSDFEVFD